MLLVPLLIDPEIPEAEIGAQVHHEALCFESFAHEPAELLVVFHDQHFHAAKLTPFTARRRREFH